MNCVVDLDEMLASRGLQVPAIIASTPKMLTFTEVSGLCKSRCRSTLGILWELWRMVFQTLADGDRHHSSDRTAGIRSATQPT